jgi:hypothetical protein
MVPLPPDAKKDSTPPKNDKGPEPRPADPKPKS